MPAPKTLADHVADLLLGDEPRPAPRPVAVPGIVVPWPPQAGASPRVESRAPSPAAAPAPAAAGQPVMDDTQAAQFLADWVKGWEPTWHLHVAAIPAASGAPVGHTWPAGEVAQRAAEIAAWVKAKNDARNGVYFTPNPLRAPHTGKPRKADVAAAVCLGVDLDPPDDGRDYAARREAVLSAADAIKQGSPAPSVIVDTGNGLVVFFKLSAPISDADMARAEAASRALHRDLAAKHGLKVDGTQNADHLMRLPGTRNWPSPAKIARGYPEKPSRSRALWRGVGATLDTDTVSALAARDAQAARVPASAPRAGATLPALSGEAEDEQVKAAIARLAPTWADVTKADKDTDLPPPLRQRLDNALLLRRGLLRRWQGHTDNLKDPSRSGLALALVGCLKAAGFDLEDAARIAWVFPHGDLSDPAKHPGPAEQMRAMARAWVRSVAQPMEDAERSERIEAAARDAAERLLSRVLSADTALVQDMLAVSVRSDAFAAAEFDRNRDAFQRRANLSRSALRELRARVLAAADQARRAATRQEEAAGRPIIEIGADIAALADKCEAALAAVDPPTLFRMGDKLVEVADRPDEAVLSAAKAKNPATDIAGPATIPASANVIRLALGRTALFTMGEKPVQPPMDVASIIAERGAALRVPPLRQMVSYPVLRADGTVVTAQGYDRDTRTFATTDWSGLTLPSAPSKADAEAAVKVLLEPFADFPFAQPEAKAAFVAHVLHTLARHLLPTVPATLYSAPTAGTGKTLLASAASRIALGRPPVLLSAVNGRNSDDEMRKRLTSLMVSSRGDMVFDNQPVGEPFGGPAFDAQITSPTWSDRILGGNTTLNVPNTATIAVTGNNIRTGADTGRRVQFVYLDSHVARPEARTGFKVPDLSRHLAENRPRLLTAALTLLAAHFRHNKPLQGGTLQAPTLGSFEDWSRVVAAAVEWSGLPNPIASQTWGRALFDASGDDTDTLDALLAGLHGVFGTARFGAKDIATAFEALDAVGPDGAQPGEKAAARDALRGAVDKALADKRGDRTRALGSYLRTASNRTTPGGWALLVGPTVGGSNTYSVTRRAPPDMDAAARG